MIDLKKLILGRWQDRISTTIRLRILIGFGIASWLIGFIDIFNYIIQEPTGSPVVVIALCLLNGLIITALGMWCLSQKSPIDHHLPTDLFDGVFWVLFLLGVSSIYLLQWLIHESSEINPLLASFLLIYIVPLVRLPSGFALVTITLITALYAINSTSQDPLLYWYAIWAFGLTGWSLVLSTNMELLSQRALKASNDELKLAQNTIEHIATQNERLRISRDLHDQMGHNLAALSLQLQICDKLAKGENTRALQEQIVKAQQSTRDLFQALRQAVYKIRTEGETNFLTALHQLTEGVAGLDIELKYANYLELPSIEQGDELIYAIKECITNTIKHSDATSMIICITVVENNLSIEVRDNGSKSPPKEPGFGLQGIAERMQLVNGTLQTYFQPERGFSVILRIPLEHL